MTDLLQLVIIPFRIRKFQTKIDIIKLHIFFSFGKLLLWVGLV